jgi:hypothetical protein
MSSITIKLDRRFEKQAKGKFEKYDFVVGVLQDGPHKTPVKGGTLTSYAGGPTRKVSRKPSGMTIAQVSEHLQANTGINFYSRPFNSKKNKDILNFTKSFFDLCAGRSQAKRCENFLQAIVRNPILRGDYGRNTGLTAKIKGFNRFMIDTGQLFRAIKAKVMVRRVST